MPNAISIDPLRALTRRAGRKIPDRVVAARFEALALAQLVKDERNYRPAQPWEIQRGPDWVRQAHARGDLVCVAHPCRSAAARLHNVARRLADACRVAAFGMAERPRDGVVITAARAFLDKLDRASFDVVARKSLYYSRLLATWVDDLDSSPVCEEAAVHATLGRTWRRVTKVSSLRTLGREFCNCLARTTRNSSYGAMLRAGQAQFWVLRDGSGEGLMIAMAPAPRASYFTEVRGPRNARVTGEDPDLRELAIAIGVKPSDPPPPPRPPRPPATPVASAAVWLRRSRFQTELVVARERLIAQMRAHLLRSVRTL